MTDAARWTPRNICGWLVPSECPWFATQILLTEGSMDAECIQFAINACDDHDVAIDVGAHIGTWSRRLAEVFNHVLAFEPNEEMRGYFRANVPASNVTYSGIALGAAKGEMALENGVNSGQTHLIEGDGIEISTLDSQKLPGKLSLLKIDAEGMDVEVIRGGLKTIKRHRPVVVIEENICARRYGHAVDEARLALEAGGMKAVRRFGDNVVMTWQ